MPGTDYTFKKGERIIIDPYSVHRDPEYFENPDKFDPDRFSPKNRDRKVIDAFIGFGKGPRKCPGKNVDELFNDASQQRLKSAPTQDYLLISYVLLPFRTTIYSKD